MNISIHSFPALARSAFGEDSSFFQGLSWHMGCYSVSLASTTRCQQHLLSPQLVRTKNTSPVIDTCPLSDKIIVPQRCIVSIQLGVQTGLQNSSQAQWLYPASLRPKPQPRMVGGDTESCPLPAPRCVFPEYRGEGGCWGQAVHCSVIKAEQMAVSKKISSHWILS